MPPTHPKDGHCSDGTGRCSVDDMSECQCGEEAAAALEQDLFTRNLEDLCAGKKNNECDRNICAWDGGNGCIPAPTPTTSSPTSPPSNAVSCFSFFLNLYLDDDSFLTSFYQFL